MKSELIEHLGGAFGVTVIYTTDSDHKHYVDFRAVEIVALGMPDDTRLYHLAGADSSEDHTQDPALAENYVRGSVKWDGCCHVYFGEADNEGYLHLCGRAAWTKLTTVLPLIYQRCGELMRAAGTNLLKGEFETPSPTP